jgi:hypothetical protein
MFRAIAVTSLVLLAVSTRHLAHAVPGDEDNDGILDAADLCKGSTRGSRFHVDLNGCEHDQVDADMDGWCNPDRPKNKGGLSHTKPNWCIGSDNCKFVKNELQEMNFAVDQANDGDGWGDACNTGMAAAVTRRRLRAA